MNFTDRELALLADELRQNVFALCQQAGTGHVGGCAGATELFVTLYFGGILQFDPQNPRWIERDRVLVRGHLGPLRYALFSYLGWVSGEELSQYAAYGSRLQGHEDHQVLPGIDITPSGSLGMLLSYGVGVAIARDVATKTYRTFVFLGDGEEQEGNIAEAARHAAHSGLDSLLVVIDANAKQLGDSVVQVDRTHLATLWQAYGWNVVEIEHGNDISAVRSAFNQALAKENGRPSAIIAHTTKGYGLPGAEEHFSGYHELGHCPEQMLANVLFNKIETFQTTEATISNRPSPLSTEFIRDLSISPTQDVSTHPDGAQLEYFAQLCDVWAAHMKEELYFLTGDTFPSPLLDRTNLCQVAHCMNVGIREQHMFAMALGLSLTDPIALIIIHTLDAFVYRGLDQLYALVRGGGNAVIIGDDAGITNARNGRTHQSSIQPAAVMAIPGLVFLEPADSQDLFACFNRAIQSGAGVYYIRVHDGDLPNLPVEPSQRNTELYLVHQVEAHDVVIFSSGYMLQSSLQAMQILAAKGIGACLVNVVMPSALEDCAAAFLRNDSVVVTVYNGDPVVLFNPLARGLIKAGLMCRAIKALGFQEGSSGTLEDLLLAYHLDGKSIADTIENLLRKN